MNKFLQFWDNGGSAVLLLGLAVVTIAVGGYMSKRPNTPPQVTELSYRQVFEYPELRLKVIVTRTDEVQQNCSGIPFLDDGTPTPKGTMFGACWDPHTRLIWVDQRVPEAIYHELCHASGRSPKECNQVRLEVH